MRFSVAADYARICLREVKQGKRDQPAKVEPTGAALGWQSLLCEQGAREAPCHLF